MSKLLKGAGSVVLAMVLALSWLWATWLKDAGYIDNRQRLWTLMGLTLALALQQIYLVLPKPEGRGAVDGRRDIIESYLSRFRTSYNNELASLLPGQPPPPVRLNIMLPTRRARGLLGSYLKIYYYSCPPEDNYTDDERSLKWKSKSGTCGYTWKCGDISIFDSVEHGLQLSAARLQKAQAKVVGEINSALSVPIWHDNKVVGVFSLDSKRNVAETCFHHAAVYVLAARFARTLEAQCHPDGVKA